MLGPYAWSKVLEQSGIGLDWEIHRIGERNLLNAIQTNLFDQAINRYSEDRLANRQGAAV